MDTKYTSPISVYEPAKGWFPRINFKELWDYRELLYFLTLRDIQGLSYEDISRILKLSPGTVDSRLHRARRMLRTKLAPYLTSEGGANELSQG